jgi:hypothetical protein
MKCSRFRQLHCYGDWVFGCRSSGHDGTYRRPKSTQVEAPTVSSDRNGSRSSRSFLQACLSSSFGLLSAMCHHATHQP